jgi:hypothetical protein
MLRLLAEYLLPLLLPTALYLLWLLWRRMAAARGAGVVPEWTEGPWFWLVLAGIGLSLCAFVIGGVTWGHMPAAAYHPARTIDGRIEPGHFGERN